MTTDEYDKYRSGRNFVTDYVPLTGDMEPSDTVDLARQIMGLNVSIGGLVKVTTDAGTTATIRVNAGNNSTGPIQRIWVEGMTATIQAGLI